MVKKKSAAGKGKRGFVIELTPFSSLLWAVGLLFVLAWVFVLGIFVGRGFLPGNVTAFSDMKTRVKRIQSMINRDEPVKEPDRDKKETNPQLAFYESLSSKKDEVKKQWQTPPPKKTPAVPRLRASIPSGENRPNIAPSDQKPAERKKTESSGRAAYFTIQLASLRDPGTAEKLVDHLNQKGYSAVYYYQVEVRGRTYYRVRYGRFDTREDAEKYVRELARKEGLNGFVATLD